MQISMHLEIHVFFQNLSYTMTLLAVMNNIIDKNDYFPRSVQNGGIINHSDPDIRHGDMPTFLNRYVTLSLSTGGKDK